MDQSSQDVKKESTPVAEVKEQPVNQDVKKEVNADPEFIHYARFAEATKQRKELQEKVSEYEKQAESQRQKELEKKGEYETLLNETRAKYERAKAKADEYDSYVASRKDAILSTYDEDERDIVGDLSLAKLERYHENKNLRQKVGVDNTRGGTTNTLPPADFHAMSDEEMKDPQKWQNYLNQFTRRK
jgi:hypothetical protein